MLIKRADPASEYAAGLQAKMQMPGNQNTVRLARGVGALSLGAFGIMAALRGAHGLADVYRGSHSPPPRLPMRRNVVTVDVPSREKDAGGPCVDAARAFARIKRAAGPADVGLVPKVVDFFGGLKAPGGQNWGVGNDTLWNYAGRGIADKPALFAANALGVIGGGYAGYKLTDMALDKSKDVEQDSELDAAKKRYEAALMPKSAADDRLGRVYDLLMEKGANMLGPLNLPAGAYMLAATLMAGGGAVAGYNWQQDHDGNKQVQDAMRLRRERLFAGGPPPLYAVPREVGGRKRHALPAPKTANAGQAADGMIGRFERQKQELAARTAAMFGMGRDAKPAGSAKPAAPAPPQLPSVASRLNPQSA